MSEFRVLGQNIIQTDSYVLRFDFLQNNGRQLYMALNVVAKPEVLKVPGECLGVAFQINREVLITGLRSFILELEKGEEDV